MSTIEELKIKFAKQMQMDTFEAAIARFKYEIQLPGNADKPRYVVVHRPVINTLIAIAELCLTIQQS